MPIHWIDQLMMCLPVFLAFVLGGVIGLERQLRRAPAGFRTHAAVSMGACIFGLISTHALGASYYHSVVDPTRIAAQIVSGIGFIGAGLIFRDGTHMNGLTTAATIWVTAAIGLSVAFELYIVAAISTVLLLFILTMDHMQWWKHFHKRIRRKVRRDEAAA